VSKLLCNVKKTNAKKLPNFTENEQNKCHSNLFQGCSLKRSRYPITVSWNRYQDIVIVIPLSLKRPRYTVTVSWNRYQDIIICHSTLSKASALYCYRFMKQVPGYCYLSFHSLKRPRYTVIVSNPSLYKKQVQGDSYLCTRRINIRYSENVIADNIRKIC
jgi:hypothetical protein